MKNYTDNEINALIEKYGNTVYKVAFSYCKNRTDADDVFQDVFLRFFRSNTEFDNAEHEKAWFIRVTINCCKSLVTSSWNKKMTSLEYMNETSDNEPSFLMEEKSELFYAVLNLPIKYREVIHLHYYEDYSIKEIANILDRSVTAVGTQLQRGREMLKKQLSEEDML